MPKAIDTTVFADTPAPEPHTVADVASALLRSSHSSEGFEVLCRELGNLCPFENFIVYLFCGEEEPSLVYGNRIHSFRESMRDYINGLFTLDPFFALTKEQGTGLYRMQDIMPPAFPRSEYYNHFYRYTNVADELRYVVALSGERSLHVFIEREGKGKHFSASDIHALHCVEPVVQAFIAEHMAWLNDSPDFSGQTPSRKFDLQQQVRNMKPDTLTPREVDTVELMLKGHSTKSIAQVLDIDHGTVANHKRNLYAKLEVHSQAELFHLFLSSLVEEKL